MKNSRFNIVDITKSYNGCIDEYSLYYGKAYRIVDDKLEYSYSHHKLTNEYIGLDDLKNLEIYTIICTFENGAELDLLKNEV